MLSAAPWQLHRWHQARLAVYQVSCANHSISNQEMHRMVAGYACRTISSLASSVSKCSLRCDCMLSRSSCNCIGPALFGTVWTAHARECRLLQTPAPSKVKEWDSGPPWEYGSACCTPGGCCTCPCTGQPAHRPCGVQVLNSGARPQYAVRTVWHHATRCCKGQGEVQMHA